MINYGFGVLLGDIPAEARIWRNEMDVMKWCRQSDYIHPHQQAIWVEAQQGLMYGVWQDGLPIGVCGFTGVRHPHACGEWSQYTNYPELEEATAKTLISHGFLSLRLNRIWADIFEHNTVKIKLAEKLGFQHEGILRKSYFKEGRWIDSHIYGLLREEWDEW